MSCRYVRGYIRVSPGSSTSHPATTTRANWKAIACHNFHGSMTGTCSSHLTLTPPEDEQRQGNDGRNLTV